MKYRIRNWSDHQHYKDRNPPWIKLHFSLLTSKDWVMLDDASRVLAVASMLIASRSEPPGVIDADPDYFQRVAYLNSEPDFNPLIQCGFIEPLADASTGLADARPEERQRRDRDRGEERAETLSPSKIPPVDFQPTEIHVKQLRVKRPDLDIPTVTELFRHTEYQYPRTDWDAAFFKFALTQRAMPKPADDDDAIARWARGEIPDKYREQANEH